MNKILKILSVFALIALVISSCRIDEPSVGDVKLSVSTTAITLPREAGNPAIIEIQSNHLWTIEDFSWNDEVWYRITPEALQGESDGRITVVAHTNPGPQRQLELTISTLGGISRQVVITQEGDGTIPMIGDGTEQNPYSVHQVILLVENGNIPRNRTNVWVRGYIVGGVANDLTGGGNAIVNPEDVVFGTVGVRNSAAVIADSPDETDFRRVIPVNLPFGEIRNAIDLGQNPGNLGKEWAVRGSLRRYFAWPGVHDITDHDFEGGSGPDPIDPDPVSALAEDFQLFRSGTSNVFMGDQPDSRGWRGVRVNATLEADVRAQDGNIFVHFSAHRASGVNVGDAQDFWLISPRLDLDAATEKTLSFDLRNGHHNPNTEFRVYILDGYDPTTATKTELTNWTRPPVNTGTITATTPWTSSGEIDLSAFSGVKRIGFFYSGTSGSGNSSTYQLDNFVFGDGEFGPPPPPPTEHEITDTLATWVFSSATVLENLTATSGSGIITRNITTALSFTGSDRTIWCSGWNAVGRYWLITIPVDREVSGDVIVNFRTRGTATSPRDWRMQISSDNQTWTDGETYTIAETIDNRSVKATLPTSITSGNNVYIRLVTTSTTAINGGSAAAGGNSRLADVVVGM